MRTVTKMASAVEPGDVLLVLDRVAVVRHNLSFTQRGAIATVGPVDKPKYIYWHAISFVWADDKDGVISSITIEGNRWIYTRDQLDQPMPQVERG